MLRIICVIYGSRQQGGLFMKISDVLDQIQTERLAGAAVDLSTIEEVA